MASSVMPRLTKGNATLAVSAMMRMSAGRTIVRPTPTALPFIAATTTGTEEHRTIMVEKGGVSALFLYIAQPIPKFCPHAHFRHRKMDPDTSPPPSRWWEMGISLGAPKPSDEPRLPTLRSAPAQNALPAPVSTTARTRGSASASSNTNTSEAHIAALNELSLHRHAGVRS